MCEVRTDSNREHLFVWVGDKYEHRPGQNGVVRWNHGQWISVVCINGSTTNGPTVSRCLNGTFKLPNCYRNCRLPLNEFIERNLLTQIVDESERPFVRTLNGNIDIIRHNTQVKFICYGLRSTVGPDTSRCDDGVIDVPTCHDVCVVNITRLYMRIEVVGERFVPFDDFLRSGNNLYVKHNQSIIATCEEFYTLNGPSELQCLDGDITLPFCNALCRFTLDTNIMIGEMSEEPYNRSQNGVYDHIEMKHGQRITFSCLEKSVTPGPFQSRCKNGIVTFPRCFALCLVHLKKNVILGEVYEEPYKHFTIEDYEIIYMKHGQQITFSCPEKTTMTGSAQSWCRNGDISIPTCHDMCFIPIDHKRKILSMADENNVFHLFEKNDVYVEHHVEIIVNCLERHSTNSTNRAFCEDGKITVPTCHRDCPTSHSPHLIARSVRETRNANNVDKYASWAWLEKGYIHHGLRLQIMCTSDNLIYVGGSATVECDDGQLIGELGECIKNSASQSTPPRENRVQN